jgi:hypothetical protein
MGDHFMLRNECGAKFYTSVRGEEYGRERYEGRPLKPPNRESARNTASNRCPGMFLLECS